MVWSVSGPRTTESAWLCGLLCEDQEGARGEAETSSRSSCRHGPLGKRCRLTYAFSCRRGLHGKRCRLLFGSWESCRAFAERQATSAEATRTLGADNVDAATCAAIDSSFSIRTLDSVDAATSAEAVVDSSFSSRTLEADNVQSYFVDAASASTPVKSEWTAASASTPVKSDWAASARSAAAAWTAPRACAFSTAAAASAARSAAAVREGGAAATAANVAVASAARSAAAVREGGAAAAAARVTLGTVCTRAGNTDVLSHPVVMTLSRASGPASHIYVAACANKVYIYIYNSLTAAALLSAADGCVFCGAETASDYRAAWLSAADGWGFWGWEFI